MQSPNTHSGPHKLDVRLLLYTVATTKYKAFTAAEQNSWHVGFPLSCSALAPRKATPRLLARFRDFERPEHAPRSQPGTETCAVVYRQLPCVPRSRERQYRTVQHSTAQCSAAQCSTAQHSTARYGTVRYSTVQYSTVQYSTVQYSTVQHGTALTAYV